MSRILINLLINLIPVALFAQTPLHTFRSGMFRDTVGVSVLRHRNLYSGSHPGLPFSGASRSEPVSTTHATPLGRTIQMTITTSPSTCYYGNGTILITPSGGTPPYSYSIDNGSWQYSGIFFTGGTVTVNVKDATGQVASTTVTVPNNFAAPLPWVGTSHDPSTCTSLDGSATLTVQSGTAPYLYSMDLVNWQASPTFSNLPDGVYYFYVKDANGCMGYTTWFTRACAGGAASVSMSACGSNGIISFRILPYTSNPPYSYSLDGVNYQPTGEFDGLSPGMYIVHIKDGSGNVIYYGWYIASQCFLTLTAITSDAACGSNNGTITVTATNGQAPYQYSIDGINYQSGNVFSGLAPGNYEVVVLDADHKMQGVFTTVGGGCLALTTTEKDATCGGNNGSITVTGQGGTPPYTYSLDGTNFQNSVLFQGLAGGAYTVTIKDAANQTATNAITVANIAGPLLSVTTQPVGCDGNGGSITLNATGGATPYQYSYGQNAYASANTFNLSPGTYQVNVMDANGCAATAQSTVIIACLHLAAVGSNPSCGLADGSITATASHGTLPYSYSLDGTNFQPSPLFNGLAVGVYTVTAKDAAGLTNTASVTLYDECIVVQATPTPSICNKPNGQLSIVATGGAAPYQYSIDGVNYQATGLFSPLAPGNYTVTARDSRGVVGSQSVSIPNVPEPQVQVNTLTATCLNNDGGIQAIGNSGVSPYQFSLDGSSFGNTAAFNGLASGAYTVYIRDADGCINQGTTVVPLNNTITADAGAGPTICQGRSVVILAHSNATSFSWQPSTGLNDPAILQPTASPSTTTAYTLTATEGPCQQTSVVNVIVEPAPVADAGTNDTICVGRSIMLRGTGGTTFAWSPATYLDDPAIGDPTVEQPAESISYSLTVTDANGCQSLKPAEVRVTVTPPAQLIAGPDTAVLAGQPVPLYAEDVNGSGFVRFTWSPSRGLNDATIQDPTAALQDSLTYTVIASTAAGCAAEGSVSIKVYAIANIFVPNAFTPNDDGHNDVLRAIPVGIREFKYFAVYARWGQRVFYTSQPAEGWNGTFNGTMQPTGTYAWITGGIDYRGEWIVRKGTVILIR